jgi:hypothetical protein
MGSRRPDYQSHKAYYQDVFVRMLQVGIRLLLSYFHAVRSDFSRGDANNLGQYH